MTDTDADFLADRQSKAFRDVDKSVYDWAKLLKLQPHQCEECMDKVRAILRAYEPS